MKCQTNTPSDDGQGYPMTTRFDAIIIGTGQSGPSLAARLAGAGRKVAIIERNYKPQRGDFPIIAAACRTRA